MIEKLNAQFGIGEQLRFEAHPSGLVQGIVNTARCRGSFFLLGAHLATFQPTGQSQPVLFMSREAVYEVGKPIRGGVPICFPWFGAHKTDTSQPSHGLVRTELWQMLASSTTPEYLIVQLQLTTGPFELKMTFKFGSTLDMQLDIRNISHSTTTCEVALHTYFELGDATQATILGLETHIYRDQLTGESCAAAGQPTKFIEETDRVYDREVPLIEIVDPVFKRSIQIRPRNSQSTVVWNPWIAKSIRLPDFGDLEYGRMCCVETANVGKRQMQIAPREMLDIGVEIATTNS